jgi:hypothetical protein
LEAWQLEGLKSELGEEDKTVQTFVDALMGAIKGTINSYTHGT